MNKIFSLALLFGVVALLPACFCGKKCCVNKNSCCDRIETEETVIVAERVEERESGPMPQEIDFEEEDTFVK